MAWSIESPEDKSFADSDTEEDVALLKGYVLCEHMFIVMICRIFIGYHYPLKVFSVLLTF